MHHTQCTETDPNPRLRPIPNQMCGFLGIVTLGDNARSPDLSPQTRSAIAESLAHRGPDAHGTASPPGALLIHRRLEVIAPGHAGDQPASAGGEGPWLVYNGELYNDPEVRGQLTGVSFDGSCDTETILRSLAAWSPEQCAKRWRGMYALAAWFPNERRLVLMRDPLGIKPLYYAETSIEGDRALVFASEPAALFASGLIDPEPDPFGLIAYTRTIRTVVGQHTMFAGVRAVQPGETVTIDCRDSSPSISRDSWWSGDHKPEESDLGEALRESVSRHLRSDVELCSLLSGGIDSTVIATCAKQQVRDLHTWCAGAPGAADGLADDFAFAQQAADAIGSAHTEVPVDQQLFLTRWISMVGELGVPLSTPNEVAINSVSRALKSRGMTVALSGEGADELLAGYEMPMTQAWRLSCENRRARASRHGMLSLEANSWISNDLLRTLVRESHTDMAGAHGDALSTWYGEEAEAIDARSPDLGESPEQRALHLHLRLQRRVNLSGLLQRLDTATMLASVEGRTPFADAEIAVLCDHIPIDQKVAFDTAGQAVQTKRPLREAFAGVIPESILARPKRSFPLPFQGWLAEARSLLTGSEFLLEWFRPEALAAVAADPVTHWNLAWPLMNVSLWGERWWGAGAGDSGRISVTERSQGVIPGHSPS